MLVKLQTFALLGIEAVPVDELQLQAFLQVARKDAGRLERLKFRQASFDRGASIPVRNNDGDFLVHIRLL